MVGTLRLTRPSRAFYAFCWLTVGAAVALGLGAELLFRQAAVQAELPAPAISREYTPINEKFRLVEEFGEVDCFFLGSSMVFNGLSPRDFEAAYQEETGESLRCFNFGLNAITGSNAGVVAYALAERYQPKLIIVGVGPRDVVGEAPNSYGEPSRIEYEFGLNPWLRYYRGDFSPEGWLIAHSAGFRALRTLDRDFLGTGTSLFEAEELALDTAGFSPLLTFELSSPRFLKTPFPTDTFDPANPYMVEDVRGLREGLRRIPDNVQVLLLEMPTIVERYRPEEDDNTLVALLEEEVVEGSTLPFWTTSQRDFLRDVYWADQVHLHYGGAIQFSRWLGRQVGAAMVGDSWEAPPLPDLEPEKPYLETLGLSEMHFAEFQDHDLLPSDALLFNPLPWSVVGREKAAEQGFYFELALSAEEQATQQATVFDLMSVLNQSRLESELPEDYAPTLEAWREDKLPEHLRSLGFEYLLVDGDWLSYLPSEHYAYFENPTMYALIGQYENPMLEEGYWLYQVGGE
jgi:hypothetical protein